MRRSQRSRYSTSSPIDEAPLISKIQRCSVRASATVRFLIVFLATKECKRGATSIMRYPCSHLSSQKSVRVPSPTSVIMAIAKKALTCSGTWIGNMLHGRWGSVLCSHSQHIRSAHPMFFKSEMPSPPSSRGNITLPQATRQCPPLVSFLPRHRNPLLILSIAFVAHCGKSAAIIR